MRDWGERRETCDFARISHTGSLDSRVNVSCHYRERHFRGVRRDKTEDTAASVPAYRRASGRTDDIRRCDETTRVQRDELQTVLRGARGIGPVRPAVDPCDEERKIEDGNAATPRALE